MNMDDKIAEMAYSILKITEKLTARISTTGLRPKGLF